MLSRNRLLYPVTRERLYLILVTTLFNPCYESLGHVVFFFYTKSKRPQPTSTLKVPTYNWETGGELSVHCRRHSKETSHCKEAVKFPGSGDSVHTNDRCGPWTVGVTSSTTCPSRILDRVPERLLHVDWLWQGFTLSFRECSHFSKFETAKDSFVTEEVGPVVKYRAFRRSYLKTDLSRETLLVWNKCVRSPDSSNDFSLNQFSLYTRLTIPTFDNDPFHLHFCGIINLGCTVSLVKLQSGSYPFIGTGARFNQFFVNRVCYMRCGNG